MAKQHSTRSKQNAHKNDGYEKSDLTLGGIALFVFVMTATIVVSMVAATFLFNNFDQNAARKEQPVSPLVTTQAPPPEPHLQSHPQQDREEMRAAEEAILNHYGWVNQSKGVVRIPIERAIELTAERGLPVR